MAESKDIRVNMNKRVRGRILGILETVHPVPVEIKTIAMALLEHGYTNSPDLAAHIDYLAGKNYITVIGEDATERIFHGALPPATFVKLSPHGIDLLEGTIEDPGVDA